MNPEQEEYSAMWIQIDKWQQSVEERKRWSQDRMQRIRGVCQGQPWPGIDRLMRVLDWLHQPAWCSLSSPGFRRCIGEKGKRCIQAMVRPAWLMAPLRMTGIDRVRGLWLLTHVQDLWRQLTEHWTLVVCPEGHEGRVAERVTWIISELQRSWTVEHPSIPQRRMQVQWEMIQLTEQFLLGSLPSREEVAMEWRRLCLSRDTLARRLLTQGWTDTTWRLLRIHQKAQAHRMLLAQQSDLKRLACRVDPEWKDLQASLDHLRRLFATKQRHVLRVHQEVAEQWMQHSEEGCLHWWRCERATLNAWARWWDRPTMTRSLAEACLSRGLRRLNRARPEDTLNSLQACVEARLHRFEGERWADEPVWRRALLLEKRRWQRRLRRWLDQAHVLASDQAILIRRGQQVCRDIRWEWYEWLVWGLVHIALAIASVSHLIKWQGDWAGLIAHHPTWMLVVVGICIPVVWGVQHRRLRAQHRFHRQQSLRASERLGHQWCQRVARAARHLENTRPALSPKRDDSEPVEHLARAELDWRVLS